MMTKIIILYTDAGGGHKSTALTLQEIIKNNTDWQVELINPYKEMCAEFDLLKYLFGIAAEDLYNRYVSEKRSALIKLLIFSGFFKLNLAIPSNKIVRKLTAEWQQRNPNMLISVTPFINDILADSVTRLTQPIPFVTVVTDYQECCKNIWIARKQQKLICSSAELVARALKYRVPAENIYQLSGMLVAEKFYTARAFDKNVLCAKLGLRTNMPTAIVTFGSHGSADMLNIAKSMCNCNYKIQMVFICGYDTQLQQQLQTLKVNYPLIATGFVGNIEEYMRCADVFIGKPGGLSISEAAIMHLPLIVKYNLFTLLHERHNAKWVLNNNIGISIKSVTEIPKALANVLQTKEEFIKQLQSLENNSNEEILPILSAILGLDGDAYQKTSLLQKVKALI